MGYDAGNFGQNGLTADILNHWIPAHYGGKGLYPDFVRESCAQEMPHYETFYLGHVPDEAQEIIAHATAQGLTEYNLLVDMFNEERVVLSETLDAATLQAYWDLAEEVVRD